MVYVRSGGLERWKRKRKCKEERVDERQIIFEAMSYDLIFGKRAKNRRLKTRDCGRLWEAGKRRGAIKRFIQRICFLYLPIHNKEAISLYYKYCGDESNPTNDFTSIVHLM